MEVDITRIVLALIGLCSAVITGFLIPYLKSKLNNEQEALLQTMIDCAVAAAEQLFRQPGSGADKKQYVLNWLTENGINIDSAKLDAMIESAVYTLTHTFSK
jgi:hypothetical protein